MHEREYTRLDNSDSLAYDTNLFRLRSSNVPEHLQDLLTRYDFRRCSAAEIDDSVALTHNAWPGLPESTSLDLRANEMINAPMCGAFNANDEMVGYTRLLWGYDNRGYPEIVSHMTAVKKDIRDSGIGEALKWLARQIALEFPAYPVGQLSVTFDNLQGRNCYVNITKLGMICGAAGGVFKENAYDALTGEQHRGNPTDRYKARWYLDSPWVKAHLNDEIKKFSLEEVRSYPCALQVNKETTSDQMIPIILPDAANAELQENYITLPIPLNWDVLLSVDKDYGYALAKAWRTATRTLLPVYFGRGYTVISQIQDSERWVNFQIMMKNFDPFKPPKTLLKTDVGT